MTIHIVKPEETLYSIARDYGVSPQVLQINNGIRTDGELAVGQSIAVVYPETTHTVIPGDTLYNIAREYGVTVNDLYRNNLILNGSSDIYPGQTLIVRIQKEPIGDYRIGGYSYPFISQELLDQTLPFMHYIIPFTYGFSRDGSLVDINDTGIIERAQVYGSIPYMHFSSLDENDVFNVDNAKYLLENRALWDVVLNNILTVMREKGYQGLDVDFEFLGKENEIRYVEFVTFLRENLNENGYPVIVALAPKTSDEQPGVLYEGHNYALLGEAANYVLIMTYEWGYTYGPPLAVSPLPSVRRVVEYAVSRIPNYKIYLGISNYGYDFTLPYVQGESKAPSVSTVEAVNLAVDTNSVIYFDGPALAPYFNYTRDEVEHEVWFEDARSIREKLLLIDEYNLRGGLYWNLNRENPQNLTVLNSMIIYDN